MTVGEDIFISLKTLRLNNDIAISFYRRQGFIVNTEKHTCKFIHFNKKITIV